MFVSLVAKFATHKKIFNINEALWTANWSCFTGWFSESHEDGGSWVFGQGLVLQEVMVTSQRAGGRSRQRENGGKQFSSCIHWYQNYIKTALPCEKMQSLFF